MKSERILTALFLFALLASTFFSLSAQILSVKFCALPMPHQGRLCDVVNNLNQHHFFGSAVAVFFVFAGALMVLFGTIRPDEARLSLSSAEREREGNGISPPKLITWLLRHYNSPNALLATR